jgi:hypothetical protein
MFQKRTKQLHDDLLPAEKQKEEPSSNTQTSSPHQKQPDHAAFLE